MLRLVEQLPPEQQSELRRKLNGSWQQRWDKVTSDIREHAKQFPPLTEEEIAAEVKAVREEEVQTCSR